MIFTEEWYTEYLKRTGKGKAAAPVKGSKYHAVKTWFRGICFDSKKEADFCGALMLMHRAGEIAGFLYHGKFIVIEGEGQENRGTCYEPDFVILNNDGTYRIVDTKGMATPEFKLKMKLMKSRYPNIKVELP